MAASGGRPPRIVVTLMVAAQQPEVEIALRKNALYVDSVVRHGATAIPLDATASAADRAGAFASMDGLLITGGADIEPARYGATIAGSEGMEPDRDELEAQAYAAADRRGLPILGLCRGLQAMNVFAGGTLVQHVDGHAGPGYGHGPAHTHELRMEPASRMAGLLTGGSAGGDGLYTVNSYHHQAVLLPNLAPAYVAAGWSSSPDGDLVEALESSAGPWRMAVQCHPERTESTPRTFERLFAAFVEACRVR
ncbi:MAG: gamma-glutamyl-gamma-aminobutyrate hydrolase family protein [Chloroflexota bacterium]